MNRFKIVAHMIMITMLLSYHLLCAQNISTVVSTNVNQIESLTIDSHGNLFITTYGNQVKKIDTNSIVTLIAGTGVAGFSGDNGPATNANLNYPLGITVDSEDNVIFADNKNNRIRKIDVSTGVITTIVGSGSYGGIGSFSGDGSAATNSTLFYPEGVCFDKGGNLYVADASNYRIRKINTSGTISTYVGSGIAGSTGDGGPATLAKCWPSEGIVIDNSGNLYFTQSIAYPMIRKVTVAGIISTIAGDSLSHSFTGEGIPATNAHMNAQNLTLNKYDMLFICDEAANNRVRYIDRSGIIHTAVGNGTNATTGDGGPATAAAIAGPTGIAFDRCNNLYIGDFDGNNIRKVAFNPYCWPTEEPILMSADSVVIYPTPATDEIHVDGLKICMEYRLLNTTGIRVQHGHLNTGNNTILIPQLPPGLYLLQLVGDDGSKEVRKVVKE